ncbi:MAG: pilin [Pseudomonadota bacterium]
MKSHGFTLIELMIVVAIIGILASIAMPAYQDYTIRAQVVEAFSLTGELKESVREYYKDRGEFPADNETAGVPEPEHLLGMYVSGIEVSKGGAHVTFGHQVNSAISGKVLSIRPVAVTDSPMSPISWACGYRSIPDGMQAVGENLTTVEPRYLPSSCRP